MTTQNPSFNELVGKLRTKKGRAIATIKAMERYIQVSDKHLIEAQNYYASIGDYDNALKLCRDYSVAERMLANYKVTKKKNFEQDQPLTATSDLIFIDYLGMTFKERCLKVASEQINIAKKAEEESNIRYVRDHYKNAIIFLQLAGSHTDAYNLAIRQGLIKLADEVYINGIKILERLGRFDAAAELEKVRGDLKRIEIYQTLDNLLKTT